MTNDLTRPIIGIENRTAQEVFDIMSARFTAYLANLPGEPVAWLHPTARWAKASRDVILPHCRKDGPQPVPLYAHPPATVTDEAVERAGEWRDPNSGITYTAAELAALLEHRDSFIVLHGLWSEYVASLDARAALEAAGGRR